MTSQNLDLSRKILSLIFQAYLIFWMLNDVKAQYDYENEGSLASSGGVSPTTTLTGQRSRGPLPIQMTEENLPWNRVNQMVFDKCMQLQRMAVKKRNFGLEIPAIIIGQLQDGKKGNLNLNDIRERMIASGKRK